MKTAFNLANKDRLRSLSTSSAGFAGKALATGFAGKALAYKENEAPTPAAQTKGVRPDGPGGPSRNPMGFYYCWSHGLLLSRENHSSQTCRTRAPGHKEEATALNMMGGNNTIRRRQNQPAVYCAPVSD
jgi:hypothetical protein